MLRYHCTNLHDYVVFAPLATEKVVELPTSAQTYKVDVVPTFTKHLQSEMRVPIENRVAR